MGKSRKAIQGLLAISAIFISGIVLAQNPAADPGLRYSHATQLKLRKAPAANAETLAQLSINQAVSIVGQKKDRWCEIKLIESGQTGFVDCTYLGKQKLTAKTLEIETARLWLLLNQPNLSKQKEAQLQESLFTQIEKSFALSPSLYAYRDYTRLYQAIYGMEKTNASAKNQLSSEREATLQTMRQSLSRQTWQKDYVPVRGSLMTTLGQTLLQRRYGDVARYDGKKQQHTELPGGTIIEPAKGESFFSQGKWAMGWAGGPMINRLSRDNEVAYTVNFSASGPWVLADLYEMAKVHGVPINVQIDPSQAGVLSDYSVGIENMVLETKLPIWVITRDGLVPGYLRKASVGGNACTDRWVTSAAEITFERPVKGNIYGVFASSDPFDVQKAVVTVHPRTFMGSMKNNQIAPTYRVDTHVDIDNDGIDDLRVVLSSNMEVADFRSMYPHQVAMNDSPFRKVSSGQPYNVHSFQVNESGWWRLLSLYHLIVCS